MGGERTGKRKYLYLCATGLIIALTASCASLNELLVDRQERSHLQRVGLLTGKGDFEGALREDRQLLALSPKSPPGDAALFNMALVYAAPANPGKDYRKALMSLRRLADGFPQSRYAAQAAVWRPLLEDRLSPEREGLAHLQNMQELARQGRFSEALVEDARLLDRPPGPLRDAALFSTGLIYADWANPGRDGKKALELFSQLVKESPPGIFTEDGRVWAGVLEKEIAAETVGLGQEGRAHLQRMRLLMKQGDFEGASRENQKVLAGSPKASPADAALFSMALICADYANPDKDYKKAIAYLWQLVRDFPQSPLAEGARIMAAAIGRDMAGQEGRAHLQRMQLLVRKGDFEEALKENQRVLATPPKTPDDAALFSLGLIYADRSYPKMDYRKALAFFQRLRRDFPSSPYQDEARVWIGVLETMEKSMQVDLEFEAKKNELRR